MITRSPLLPALALIGVTAIWGSTFFMIKDVVAGIPPLDFLGVRFVVAGLAVAVLWGRKLTRAGLRTWRRGIIAGLAYAGAQIFQTYGLKYADASVSGFITGMYVVLTPILLFLCMGRKVGSRVWIAVALSTLGLSFLSLNGVAVGIGEILTLISAFLYAIHIVLLGQWAGQEKGFDLAAIQVVTLGVVLGVAAIPGGITFPVGMGGWAALVYMALVAGLLALVIQTWAQSRIPPATAAVIMTTEPIFAALFAILLGGEHLTWRLVLGGSLVLSAMFLAEFSSHESGEENRNEGKRESTPPVA